MDLQLRPLTTGELLDRTFTLYRKNFVLFFGIAAVPYVIVLAMQLVIITTTAANPGIGGALAMAGGVFVGVIGYLIALALSQAAAFFAVSSVYLNEPVTIGSAYSKVGKYLGRVIGVMFAVGLLVILGLIALIVPGVIVLLGAALAIPAAVLENLGVEPAIRRSFALTKGSRGRVALVFFLGWALSLGIGMLLGGAMLAIGAMSLEGGQVGLVGQIATQLVDAIGSALVAPVVVIAMTLLYYDQRVRKEAFDIQHMMTQLGRPAAAAGATAGASQ